MFLPLDFSINGSGGGGGGGTVTVDEGLSGDGSSLNPINVNVDGVTIIINGDNELEVVGGGGGGIGGSIAANQVAFGSGTDTINGSDDFTWDGSLLTIAGDVIADSFGDGTDFLIKWDASPDWVAVRNSSDSDYVGIRSSSFFVGDDRRLGLLGGQLAAMNYSGGRVLFGASKYYSDGGSETFINFDNAIDNGAGAATGTLLNAPSAGNPTKWIAINDAGVTRYIPAW